MTSSATPTRRLRQRGAPLLAALALLVGGPLVASSIAAQPTSAQQQAIKASCQSDFRANCSGVSPGGSAALQCLEQNVAKLSAACQQAVNAVSGGAAAAPPPAPAAAPATAAPAASAPATAAPATKPPATKAPAAAAAPPPPPMTPRQEMMLVRQYCGRDFNRFCSTVRMGGGNAVACLRANAAQLSSGCKRALSAAMR